VSLANLTLNDVLHCIHLLGNDKISFFFRAELNFHCV
jgi:hypothetical protein